MFFSSCLPSKQKIQEALQFKLCAIILEANKTSSNLDYYLSKINELISQGVELNFVIPPAWRERLGGYNSLPPPMWEPLPFAHMLAMQAMNGEMFSAILDLLMQQGLDINTSHEIVSKKESGSILHNCACMHNRPEIFAKLIEAKADVNAINSHEKSVVNALLCSTPYNTTVRSTVLGSTKCTTEDRMQILSLLLESKAKLSQKDVLKIFKEIKTGSATSIKVLTHCFKQHPTVDLENGGNFLHYLAGITPEENSGYSDLVQKVIDNKCDFNQQDYDGCTAVRLAAAGNLAMLKILICHASTFSDINLDLDLADYNKKYPLHIAAETSPPCLSELIHARAQKDLIDNKGWTVMHYAVRNLKSLKLLLASNFEFDQADNDGNTPLMLAVSLGLRESASLLLKAGANIWATNLKKDTIPDLAEGDMLTYVNCKMIAAQHDEQTNRSKLTMATI